MEEEANDSEMLDRLPIAPDFPVILHSSQRVDCLWHVQLGSVLYCERRQIKSARITPRDARTRAPHRQSISSGSL
jgi:hypothetical protein